MSFELRKLEDVCDILDHMRIPITSRDRKEGPYPYYGANGIQDYIDDFIFDDELVLLAEDGGNFGSKEKPIAYRISGKTWVNNHAHVLKPKNIIDVDYLCYSLMYYDVSGLLNGATRQKLTQSEMRKINIRYRSLEKQRQMVFKIKLISNIISSREHQLSNLNLLVKSRFIEMFGDLISNTKGWKYTTLNEMCDVRDGTHDSPKAKEKGYPLLTSKNFSQGYIDFNNYYLISEDDFELINKRSKVDKGDIIMPMIGTIGSPVIVDTDIEFAIKNVALIKFTNNNVSNVFIQKVLDSNYFKNVINQTNRGNTQKFISLRDIRNIKIPIVPIKEQNQFADFVAQVDKSKFVVTAKFQ